jgi:hypothetical protein
MATRADYRSARDRPCVASQGFRWFWRWKSRRRIGRPPVPWRWQYYVTVLHSRRAWRVRGRAVVHQRSRTCGSKRYSSATRASSRARVKGTAFAKSIIIVPTADPEGISATGEAHAGGTANDRGAPRPTRSTDGGATQSPSRCGPPDSPRCRGAQDDPRTARSRLSRRTSPGCIEQPGMIGRDCRPGLICGTA